VTWQQENFLDRSICFTVTLICTRVILVASTELRENLLLVPGVGVFPLLFHCYFIAISLLLNVVIFLKFSSKALDNRDKFDSIGKKRVKSAYEPSGSSGQSLARFQ